MNLDLLITLGIIAVAGVYLVRKFSGKNKGCCGCTDCSGTIGAKPQGNCHCPDPDKDTTQS